MLIDIIHRWLAGRGMRGPRLALLADVIGVLCLLAGMWLVNKAAKVIIAKVVRRAVLHSANPWDDVFLRCGVFTRLSHLAPALVIATFKSRFFARQPAWLEVMRVALNVYLVTIALMVTAALIEALIEVYDRRSEGPRVTFRGIMQGAKLLVYVSGGIFILSLVLGRSPRYLLSGLGALTAVLLLIFRDVLLGFAAGVQISVSRMAQVGDWIELPKYGADGDIIDVGLTTTKVRNWDNTISTIPTHALTSEPLKNWRSMQELGARRIKRAIYLDIESFCFVDDTLMNRLLGFRALRPYLERKQRELAEEQRERREGNDPPACRRPSNIGCFQAYAMAYLRAHPRLRQDLEVVVRQREATDKGLPLELYAFSSETRLAAYESIQSEIFDHLLTIAPQFELRVFQSPTGYDFRHMASARESAR